MSLSVIAVLMAPACSSSDSVLHDRDADGDADVDADGDADADRPIAWVTIEAGSFTMGSPAEEIEDRPEIYETEHEVTLTNDFELAAHEVTQEQFAALMGYQPSRFFSCTDGCPVETVTWHEAAAFCNKLSDDAGLDPCFVCDGSEAAVSCHFSPAYSSPYACPGYRLPTEAEWEYAARAGTTTTTYAGDWDAHERVIETIAWISENSGSRTNPVGTLESNDWGLYDMLGNVYEWCGDGWAGDLGSEPVTDPWTEVTEVRRPIRGSNWRDGPVDARSGARRFEAASEAADYIGFRPARTL